MKKETTRVFLRACAIGTLGLMVIACPRAETENDEELAIAALLTSLPAEIELKGRFTMFSGTADTSRNGDFELSGSPGTYGHSFTYDGDTTVYSGEIVQFDNTRKVLFFRVKSTFSAANVGKFLWGRWLKHTDGKFYYCESTNGYKDTLALSISDFATIEASPGTVANPANLGTGDWPATGGCGTAAWNRLDPK